MLEDFTSVKTWESMPSQTVLFDTKSTNKRARVIEEADQIEWLICEIQNKDCEDSLNWTYNAKAVLSPSHIQATPPQELALAACSTIPGQTEENQASADAERGQLMIIWRTSKTRLAGRNQGVYMNDYCYICEQLCDDKSRFLGFCATCPRVYNNSCHMSAIRQKMETLSDNWKCSFSVEPNFYWKMTVLSTKRSKCYFAKFSWSCYENHARNVPNYQKIIQQPMDFGFSLKVFENEFARRVY